MAKDNLFLGMARGKVGDVVFSRLNGVQVSRARNRSPRNPQSVAQMIQRIIINTCSKAYSIMQPIVNHSFEGLTEGEENQRRFMKVNVAAFRDKLAAVLAEPLVENLGDPDYYNFNYKDSFLPVVNSYIMSEGVLPEMKIRQATGSGYMPVLSFTTTPATADAPTYAEIVAGLGVKAGDQLTFIATACNDRLSAQQVTEMSAFKFARVVLEPASGDMSTPFLDANGGINDPNPKNEGEFESFDWSASVGIEFHLKGADGGAGFADALSHACVILSRFENGHWLRSNAVLRPIYNGTNPPFNGAQLIEAYFSYMSGESSALYLNQAEVGI